MAEDPVAGLDGQVEDDVYVFPASYGQERLWLLNEMGAGSAYHVTGALRLTGDLDVPALASALAALLDRHEVLRTGFEIDVDGGVVQVVRPAGSVAVDLPRHTTTAEALADAVRRTEEAPFDLTAPPLLRGALIETPGQRLLVLCVHHIAVDGWSMDILLGELGALYAAAVTHTDAHLPDLPLQYADFAVWQRDLVGSGDLDGQAAYWREHLAGATPVELGADGPAPGARSFTGGSVPVHLDPALVTRVAGLAEGERATTFMVLLAAWSVLLGRWSAGSDIVTGVPVAGRTRAELDAVVGFFVNTLPLRVDVSGDVTFRDLVGRARRVALAAYDHQDVPFERIDAAGPPLVRTLLSLMNAPAERLRLPGVVVEPLPTLPGGAQFDLGLTLRPDPDGALAGALGFATRALGEPGARRFAGGLTTLLAAAVADPDRPVRELPVLTGPDRAALTGRLAGTDVPPPAGPSVPELVRATVRDRPDAVAVVDDGTGEAMTFAELDERAGRLAALLRDRGAGPETPVGVCLDRGPELIVAVWAVLRSGAVYLPLDPDQPPARLAAMIEDAAPVTVLAGRDTLDRLPPGTAVLPGDRWDGTATRPAPPVATPAGSGSAAYLLFTSGSSGRPKGVLNTHGGLANRLAWMTGRFRPGPDDVVLTKTPIGFDVSVWELLWPLVTGIPMVLARPGGHRDPGYLGDVCARRGVTVVHFVPSMLRVFLDAGAAGPGLRRIVCSGEELTAALAADVRAAAPGAVLDNLYGPTEAAIDVSAHEVTGVPGGRVPIGRPVPGAHLFVLDAAFRPVPVGVAGELYIGGVQLARGYAGRPGLTAGHFRPHPFRAGERIYATGDRARWTESGELEYLGRADGQVKIRGHRVEPGEVEAAVRSHPAVVDAVVTAAPDATGTPRLVAYLTTGDPACDEAALRAHLDGRLSAAMTPTAFVLLPSFPTTVNGKVDRAALPAPDFGRAGRERTPPRTPTEALLGRLWSDVLGVADIGVHDDFYDLGGDSLRAMTVFQRAHQQGLTLPLRVMLGRHDIEHLAVARAEPPGPGPS